MAEEKEKKKKNPLETFIDWITGEGGNKGKEIAIGQASVTKTDREGNIIK